MTKTYIRAFISMRYMKVLPLTAIPAAVCALVYYKTKIPACKVLGILLTAILVLVMLCYYGEKNTISLRLNKIKHANAYDQAMIIGTSFVLAERMLVYDRGKLKEFHYTDLKEITASEGSKERWILKIHSDTKDASLLVSTLAQAQRLCAYLQSVQPTLICNGLTPQGDGILEHIETGK